MLSMLPTLRSFMALFLAAILVVGSAIAFQDFAQAQTTGADKPVAGATPGGVNSGSSSDAELWRQIRRGDSGTVVGGDKSGGKSRLAVTALSAIIRVPWRGRRRGCGGL